MDTVKTFHAVILSCIVAQAVSVARAGTPERDKAWDALVTAAKAHNGTETKLDRSASFVFQRPDGSYLTFTRLLQSDKGRSVCLIANDENATACVDWESGKLTLGSRADPATPWTFRSLASLDAFEAEKPGVVQQLFSSIQSLVANVSRPGASHGGYWRNQNGAESWVKPSP
jgi:hypothetical protein